MFYTIFSSLCKRNLFIRAIKQGGMVNKMDKKNFKKWETVLIYAIKKTS